MVFLAWILLSIGLSALASIGSGEDLGSNLLLFGPLYFLCQLFLLPNYFICRGLPLGETSVARILSSHVLVLLLTLSLWFLLGREYAGLLASFDSTISWEYLFIENLILNLAIVIVIFELMVLMHYLYFALERSRKLENAALQQKLLISQAELQSLKATVHPHFLFNALNTLSNIALAEPEKAHRFCLLLAEFLRYSVAYSKKETATLDDELSHIQNYLGIERERFGERLRTEFSIDDSVREASVPPLILFPIVENAIKHGIDSCIEGGVLSISAQAKDETLIFTIENPVDELGRKLRGEGHGQTSVEHRLKNRYGNKGLLKTRRESGRFTVQLYIPVEFE